MGRDRRRIDHGKWEQEVTVATKKAAKKTDGAKPAKKPECKKVRVKDLDVKVSTNVTGGAAIKLKDVI